GEPADCLPGQPARPLVDAARDRIARGQFGEVQRHQELAREDDRPGPEERGAAESVTEAEELEDRGEDGDEREAGREGGVAAELAMQGRLVAEPFEVGAVGGIRRGEGGGHGAGFRRRRGQYLSLDSFRAPMTSAVTALLRPGYRR